MKRLRIAVLVSGSGRTFENFVDLSRAGDLPAEVVLCVSSSPSAFALERAKRLSVPAVTIELAKGGDVAAFTASVFAACEQARADLICLAGWLKLLRPIPERWRGRIVNVHPALLPRFGGKGMYGDRVHAAVLAAGESESGCTVHLVDDEYDHGPILLQRRCPVRPGDDVHALAARVFEEEKLAYPEAIRKLATELAP